MKKALNLIVREDHVYKRERDKIYQVITDVCTKYLRSTKGK